MNDELKEKILQALDDEVQFARTTGMYEFVMGLQQAQRIVKGILENDKN